MCMCLEQHVSMCVIMCNCLCFHWIMVGYLCKGGGGAEGFKTSISNCALLVCYKSTINSCPLSSSTLTDWEALRSYWLQADPLNDITVTTY